MAPGQHSYDMRGQRYEDALKLATLTYEDLREDDFAIFKTEHGKYPAKVLEVNADGSYLVQWFNCASGKATAKGAYKPSWYDADSNSEVFDDKEHSMPTWNLQDRHSVVIGPFNWNVNKSGRFLPAEVALKMFSKAD